jgi:hypothetical protein
MRNPLLIALLVAGGCSSPGAAGSDDAGAVSPPSTDAAQPDTQIQASKLVTACWVQPNSVCDQFAPPADSPVQCMNPGSTTLPACPPARAACQHDGFVRYYYDWGQSGPFPLPDGGYLTDPDGGLVVVTWGIMPPADCVPVPDAGTTP